MVQAVSPCLARYTTGSASLMIDSRSVLSQRPPPNGAIAMPNAPGCLATGNSACHHGFPTKHGRDSRDPAGFEMLTGQRLPVDWQGFVATRTASGASWRPDRLVF